MQELLMHISPVMGLKTLKPLTYEFGKSMLCATDTYCFALMMFAKVDKQHHPQGNFHCSLKQDGILYVTEKWENALKEIFQGKSAFLYYIKNNGATFNPAVPQFEFYQEQPVQKVVKIEDIYQELQKQIADKKLVVNYFKGEKNWLA